MNDIDKKSNIPLYIQIRDKIRREIRSGDLAPGSMLPAETQLVNIYEVSRHTIRKALTDLTSEGYLNRTKRRGTFINDPSTVPEKIDKTQRKIGLIMPDIESGFTVELLESFISTASDLQFCTILDISKLNQDNELECIDRMISCGVSGIVVFPLEDTFIDKIIIDLIKRKGQEVLFIDRKPLYDACNFVGSDNISGGFLAAEYFSTLGFKNVIYVTNSRHISAVVDRFNGFFKGIKKYDLNYIYPESHESTKGDIDTDCYSLEEFCQNLPRFQKKVPFGIFCENDFLALKVIKHIKEQGLQVGKDVAIIGFDNIPANNYLSSGLTTIAQNGYLIGEMAAKLIIEEIGYKRNVSRIVNHIFPTQLVIRKSCGEIPAENKKNKRT